MHPTIMQDGCDAYTTHLGIQGHYDTLINHTQNMLVYPDVYNIMDTFLCGLPKAMWTKMLSKGLTPESNTIEDFIAKGKALKAAQKMVDHYNWQAHLTEDDMDDEDLKPQKVGIIFMKKSYVDNPSAGNRPRILINTKDVDCQSLQSNPKEPKAQFQDCPKAKPQVDHYDGTKHSH